VKVVILAGGLGTRLAEETHSKPKPLVEIGEKPILWHIIQIYFHQGFHDFVICTGYKSEMVDKFAKDVSNENPLIGVQTLYTGENTSTGGRIKRAWEQIGNYPIMATYGDGVASIDLRELMSFHQLHGKLATVTAVRPPARFGRLHLVDDYVDKFGEKNQSDEGWINGGFFVLEPGVRNYLKDYSTPFEHFPLSTLAEHKELLAYKHHGFWQPMDTLREKQELEELWLNNKAPWKTW
jgi:glucose-1-phosphate cytidylyltransferase